MSLQHFFVQSQDILKEIELSQNLGFKLNLSDEDLHHAKVLRLKSGEHIGVIDSNTNYFECEILDFNNNIFVRNCIKKNPINNVELWLCPGLSKSNKLDDVIRACTEIGVNGFIPAEFERSVVKLDDNKADARVKRWLKIAKSAAMQSGQFSIPEIKYARDIDTLCTFLKNFDFVFICWELSDNSNNILQICDKLKNKNKQHKIAIIIGPEGGISQNEVDQIQKSCVDSEVVSLGASILRTQTAGIAAPAIINYLLSC